MKNYFFNVVLLTTLFLCAGNLNAQEVFKIGDELEADIKVTKTYQRFSKKSSKTDKELVYRKEFFSRNSSYIKLYFQNFDLAPGDYLEVQGANSKETLIYGGQGKIIDNNMTMIPDFWSRVLFDDKVVVSLYSSGKAGKHRGFEITKVAYGYSEDKIMKKLMAAKIRSICSSDNKERIACYQGTTMYEKAKSVCRLLIGGSSLCTGWLLGSEGHLMTNNHCIGSASNAQNTDYIFNYQYSGCTGSGEATRDVVASSATFIKTNSSLDYTLVKLPTNPTATYGYLSLSTAVPAKGDRIYIPQHPGGRRKEISVKTDTDANAGGFSQVFESKTGSGQQVRYYADTEGGSSGSPVLDYNSNLVIAIHNTGGCPNGSYGRCDNLISSIGSDMPTNGTGSGGGGGNPPGGTCANTVSSFPYSQGFENTIGNWQQSTSDDFNWTVRSGGTPSNNTGPSGANAGTYYVYMESSSPNYSNKSAVLTSPCFNLKNASNATVTFAYHMYGSASMGNLKLEASTDKGSTWTSVWSKSGNQGNSWQNASVNLTSYVGKDVKLRFNGTTGTTWQGDMAIDKFALSTSGSGGGGGNDTVSLEITFDNYASETSWEIKNSAGSVVASGGNYSGQASGSKVTVNKTLATGCYSLVFKDSYGDGICCSYGNGSYKLTNSSGTVLASGGQFTSTDTKNFCVGNELVQEVAEFKPTTEVITDLMVYPSPATSLIKIRIPERELTGTYRIVNVTGAVVQQGSLTKSISITDMESGVYLMEVKTDKAVYSQSFVKLAGK